MTTPPAVLMLVENMSVPTDPRVWSEARALRDRGYRVAIVSPRGAASDTSPHECIDGIHIYRYRLRVGAGGRWDYAREYAVAALKTLGLTLTVWRRHGFDVIHAANPPDIFFVIGLLFRVLGKKYVFDQHDLAPELYRVRFGRPGGALHALLRALETCSYRAAHVVVTSNASQRRAAIERGRCQPERVFVVRNGPELGTFQPVAAEPSLKRGRAYLLAYAGVMGSQDGVDYALRAMQVLVHQRGRRDVSFVLLGDGDQRQRLVTLSRALDLERYVHFAGWVTRSDLLRHLTVTDIGLTPDPSNELNDRSTMIKTMEYMAMSVPVVAFDTPETRVTAGEAALYATPNRVDDFADKIEILLGDGDRRRAMGAVGRRAVEQDLCWERSRPALWSAYEQLFPAAGGLPRPDPAAPSVDRVVVDE